MSKIPRNARTATCKKCGKRFKADDKQTQNIHIYITHKLYKAPITPEQCFEYK